MSIDDVVSAFATVFVAELPDKTMVATLVLVTRYRNALAVWAGASLAFAVHVTVAVVAGSAVSRLPERAVGVAVFLLFVAGAVVMARAARSTTPTHAGSSSEGDAETNEGALDPDGGDSAVSGTSRAVFGSFTFVAVAEWGDLTQIATAGLAARSGSPVSTWVGALCALAAVAALAAAIGDRLAARLPVRRIQLAASVIFLLLAGVTLAEVLRGG